MKPLMILIALVATLGAAKAQHVVAKTYMEKTHVSPKTGFALGFQTYTGIEVGAFYQESFLMEKLLGQAESQKEMPRFYEKQFYGAYMSYPVIDQPLYDFQFNVRTGITNGENFTITPSILGHFKPVKTISLGIGVGVRAFRPTVQSSVSIRF